MRALAALVLFMLLAACGRISEADELASVAQARSIAAEWALANLQLERGQVTQRYASEMRSSARDQLQSVGQGFTDQKSAQAEEVRALLGLKDDAAPADILGHAANLKRIEAQLESA